ncbi:MAG: glycosyltransferase [Solirubrobacteraceae bacterium]
MTPSATLTPQHRPGFERAGAPGPSPTLDLDIVIPVFNEERVLVASVTLLRDFLSGELPFSWRIVIADNASTDGTPQIGRALAARFPDVTYLRLERKGRGHALRAAWCASAARVVCYMDVDLSTDVRALLPLVAPLLSGHSEVAIGSRLAVGARVARGGKREFISRFYNHLLRFVLRARFTDAQCGFKAVRADVLPDLLEGVRDDGWFFDTELLVLAQRRGMRIHEVPVDWVDDPDSRVDIVATALSDLRGVARLLLGSPVTRFVLIGIASTIAYALLFLALADPLGSGWANAVSLAVTAVANTAANRRLTFGVRGREGIIRHQAGGLAIFALGLALTTGALGLLHAVDPRSPHLLEVTVLILASVLATVVRYLGLAFLVFRSSRQAHCPAPPRHLTVLP